MIPVSRPLFGGNEKIYLADCIDSGWISSEGPYVKKFENSVSEYVGRKFAIAVSSGAAALDLALANLNLKSGDEVILPSFTIISCISAVIRAGATPVLVDCDPVTFNLDTNQLPSKITSRTKAIMVVHLYGLPCDMDPIEEIARKHGLFIIEDAAEMLGQTYKNRKCGSFGKVSIFSFYANKIVSSGEGGMLLTDDKELADRFSAGRNLCFSPEKRFHHEELGWNYRMTNLQAAVGLAQMEQLEDFIVRKREIGQSYQKALAGIPGITLPVMQTSYAKNIFWVYPIVIEENCKLSPQELARVLEKEKIATRPFFWPMHKQPALLKRDLFKNESYPVSERIGERGIYLPGGSGITNAEIEIVASTLKKLLL